MKRIISFIALLILLSAFCASVFVGASGPSVVDEADLLTDSEENALASKIEEIKRQYDFDVLVLMVDGLDGKYPDKYAEEFYLGNGYGLGKDRDGCMLLISIADRDVVVSSNGSYGEYVFTEFGRDYILDQMIAAAGLSEGEYFDSAMLFVDYTADYLERAANGEPFDEDSIPIDWPSVLYTSALIALVVGLIVSAIYIGSLKSQLKSVAPKLDADNYIDRSSLALSVNKDTFMYKNVSKTARPQNTSTRSGGGTYHSSSGSFHSSGRKF